MKIRHFNLQGARRFAGGTPASHRNVASRRQFVKTLGLGAIAVTPSVELLHSLVKQPFTIETGEGFLRVFRHGLPAWEVAISLFGKGASLTHSQEKGAWRFHLSGATWPGTSLTFDLQGHIFHSDGAWLLETHMNPGEETAIVDFTRFLDGEVHLNYACTLNHSLYTQKQELSLDLEGNFTLEINHRWQMLLSGHQQVILRYHDQTFLCDRLLLEPFNGNQLAFLHRVGSAGTKVTLPGFDGWNTLVSLMKYREREPFTLQKGRGDLHLFSGMTSRERPVRVLWGQPSGEVLRYTGFAGETIALDQLLFVAFSGEKESPVFYASASLAGRSQWVTNGAGSFRIAGNPDLPDLEAFGYGNQVEEILFEPRLKAFRPPIEGVASRPTVFSDSPKIFFEDQDPVRRTTVPINRRITLPAGQKPAGQPAAGDSGGENQQKPGTTGAPATVQPGNQRSPADQPGAGEQQEPQDPVRRARITLPAGTRVTPQQDTVRRPQRAEPKVEVDFDKVRFRPNKAITIRFMRPEDLIWLDFEFHNFAFSNRGEAPYLELANPREKGIIVVRFPSQHTLEQAFFETTPMDTTGGNEEITLPAKHLRAGRSRLVYEVEENHPGLPLTVETLLDWSRFSLRVHPRAWIRLPQVISAADHHFIGTGTLTQRSPSPAVPSRTISSTLPSRGGNYSLKMVELARHKADRREAYREERLHLSLAPAAMQSLSPTFDINKLKIDMKVGPVPELSTAIEAPALMFISPNQVNGFIHRIEVKSENIREEKPVQEVISAQVRVLDPLNTTEGEVTELWHTILGVKTREGLISPTLLARLKTIRALWAFDANKDYKGCAPIDAPFQASLDANDRHKLVHTTSNYDIQGFQPIPVPVKNLMLTTLGAYLDWHAFFDVPTPADNYLNVIEWEHLATLGRDHYVKIVREGYLVPFGHRAALVKVTERKFNAPKKAAVNMMRMYIVVLQKEVIYRRENPEGKFIEFPFEAVRIETTQTPNIDKPENLNLAGNLNLTGKKLIPIQLPGKSDPCNKPGRSSSYEFYVMVGGKGFPFDITVTDKEGEEHQIRMPLAFVENVTARDKQKVESLAGVYNGNNGNTGKYKDINLTPFTGQQVAYAPSLVDGDTAFETESLRFGITHYPARGEGDLKFHPVMQEASVFISQVNELTGKKDPVTIGLEDDDNEGMVFARVTNQPAVNFSGGSDKAGGFLSPNMVISGLSKLQGPVGGSLDNMKILDFIGSDFFAAVGSLPSAKIFGVIDLFELLGKPDLKGSFGPMITAVTKARNEITRLKNEILLKEEEALRLGTDVSQAIAQLKTQISQQVTALLDALNSQIPKIPNFKSWFTEEAFYAEYKWKPDLLKNKEIGGILAFKVDQPKEALEITTTVKKPYDPASAPELNGNARFNNFQIELLKALSINFNYLQFKTGTSGKTDVKVDMGSPPVGFSGELSFVNSLQNVIPSSGFGDDGPYVKLASNGITAGFNIGIPNVTVGVCTLSNISLGASVNLPFTGDPLTFSFNFCTRQNPFLLTVMIYGGGGYFLLTTSLKGLVSVEAAFEFGAAAALDIGVASGSVSIMGGFYFKYEMAANQVTLTGYIRINGRLSILGIITVSLEFYLALTYVSSDKVNRLEGEATLKVKIEIFCFSKSVSCTVRRTLAGADADPTFAQMMEADHWQMYCLAYAEE